jgi:hypothetical protein
MTVDTYGSWFPVKAPGAVNALADLTGGHLMDTSEDFGASQLA